MRVGLAWLAELVPLDVPVEKLVEMLDLSGTKVETVHRPGASIDGVVVAEVLAVEAHPNADTLRLVEVSAGDGERHSVVCGAHNFEVGDRVPWARIGARLPEMEISERKIRGRLSHGMLCSASELGVGKDHSGILVLPPDAASGEDVVKLLGLDDTVLELEITPNRPDCMGMLGIAREVAALLGVEMVVPELPAAPPPGEAGVAVDIRDAEGCPRYLARHIQGVRVEPSPSWMAARLLAAGIRPISNVVDATNYVLVETGHPLHPFDAARVHERTIVVRRSTDGESFTTLDGVTRTLERGDLVIADPAKALALAGIMGGADSEVAPGTTDVILESAYFDPPTIARTSRRLGLRTEASARFERGADPEILSYAAARAAQLMIETAGGSAASPEVDCYPNPMQRRRLRLRPERCNSLLGADIPQQRQEKVLGALGFGVSVSGDALDVVVPSWRPDVDREVDLIEEVARSEGFEVLPSTIPRGDRGRLSPAQAAERGLRRVLASLGLHEVWTSSFMSPGTLDDLRLASDDRARAVVALANPMSAEESLLRSSLIPGLLRSAAYNLARGAAGAAMFEVARVYRSTGGQLADEPVMIGAIFSGQRRSATWSSAAESWDFFGAKGIVESAATAMGIAAPTWSPRRDPRLHPTRAAGFQLGGSTDEGSFGELHPDLCAQWDVVPGSVVMEVPLQALLDARPGPPSVGELPRFPATLIDVALVVDESVPAAAVESAIRTAGAPEVVSTRLFDLYRGEQVAKGRKSLAFSLELRAPERTLTDEDALAVRDRIVAAVAAELGGELRA